MNLQQIQEKSMIMQYWLWQYDEWKTSCFVIITLQLNDIPEFITIYIVL
jgi:hypothetical protein